MPQVAWEDRVDIGAHESCESGRGSSIIQAVSRVECVLERIL